MRSAPGRAPRPLASTCARRCAAASAPRARSRRCASRARRRRTPPLVVLCDISGSMDRYARMLLHFLHAITNDRDRVHVLLFGTRLTNITRHLRHRDVDVALARVAAAVDGLGGRHADRRLPRRVQPPLVAAPARPERGRAADQRRPRCRRRRGAGLRGGAPRTSPARDSSGSIRCCATTGFEARPAGIRAHAAVCRRFPAGAQSRVA